MARPCLEGKYVKTTTCDADMIKAIIIHALMSVVLIAHPRGKIVPVRILNSSHEPVHRQKRLAASGEYPGFLQVVIKLRQVF